MPRITILLLLAASVPAHAEHLHYGWQKTDGISLFYREGGRAEAPTIVFLHGNPSSSIMYEEVMENLLDAEDVHVLAVDYPSFGYSEAPDHMVYRYTFENVALTVHQFLKDKGVGRYGLFMQDYGVPIGFHLIEADPHAVTAIIIQNGVIHLDGFPDAQGEDGELRQHWLHRNPRIDARRAASTASLAFPTTANWSYSSAMSPDAILLMSASAQRPGVILARNDMWFDYGKNVLNYPAWQAHLRGMNVPVLIMWGNRDDFFTTPGAVAYLRDAPKAKVHIFDGDHFATLEQPDVISPLLASFLVEHRNELISARP
jgi:pimeloyl-ACP methyl ester carboxylesterase